MFNNWFLFVSSLPPFSLSLSDAKSTTNKKGFFFFSSSSSYGRMFDEQVTDWHEHTYIHYTCTFTSFSSSSCSSFHSWRTLYSHQSNKFRWSYCFFPSFIIVVRAIWTLLWCQCTHKAPSNSIYLIFFLFSPSKYDGYLLCEQWIDVMSWFSFFYYFNRSRRFVTHCTCVYVCVC